MAIKSYKKAIELNPTFIEAWNNLGLSYTFKDDFKESIKCYEEALNLQEEDAVLYENLAFSYS
ncbi:unnamed protein product, partial [marine sediment metagenome]